MPTIVEVSGTCVFLSRRVIEIAIVVREVGSVCDLSSDMYW